jgi:rubrerythrin
MTDKEVPMSKMSIEMLTVLGKCVELELKNMELYDLYADCFSDDLQMARLWRKVAREEEDHANQFKLAAKIKNGGIGSIHVDPWKVENAILMVQSIINAVKSSPPMPEDALRSALKLEEHLSGFHVECVAEFEDEQLKTLFHAMMAVDDEHVKRLREVYEQRIKSRRHLGGLWMGLGEAIVSVESTPVRG